MEIPVKKTRVNNENYRQFNVRLPVEIHERMQKFPHVAWGEFTRTQIEAALDQLEAESKKRK